ncbi:hypothetical protein BHM03_00003672 [Ensete ventricosum]|uniref:Phospholipase C n=1 Tax=Ensete ventricosum TaxID=4639 RepID=A0A445MA41_ENSVE|nr:hypothetical protein BHM03_00003672 [Ensete ventricosum]
MDSGVQWRGRGRRRLLAVAVFVLYLVASAHCLDAERAVGRRNKKAKHEIKGPIKTLVVLVMENRSFDHMLGWLRTKGGRPDIDGLTGRESNHVKASDPSSPEVFVSDGAAYVDYDPGHSFQAIREQIFGSDDTSAVPAPMSGFAQQAERMGEGMAGTVMRGFAPEAVPVYSALAEEFAVFDRWFASVPASTQPNRFYVHSATSHGASSNVRRDLIHGFPQKTIFDSLDEDGLSFGVYYQNIPAVLFFKSLRKLKHLVKFHSYKLAFKLHAKQGRLPNYVVIEQHYFDVKLSPANDDHPSHDVARGQRLVKEVYETLRASPQWNETALLITYDEHGGFYDHVPTPVTGVPNPDGIIGPDPFYFKFDRLGVRVPTILISPWIEKRTAVRSFELDLLSIWRLIERLIVELIQLASQLNGDHVLNTYPDIGKGMTVGQANRYAEDAVARLLEAGRAALRAGANESAIVTMRPALTSRTKEGEPNLRSESFRPSRPRPSVGISFDSPPATGPPWSKCALTVVEVGDRDAHRVGDADANLLWGSLPLARYVGLLHPGFQIFRMDSSFVPDERHTEAITIGITVCGLCCTLSVEHQTNLRVLNHLTIVNLQIENLLHKRRA